MSSRPTSESEDGRMDGSAMGDMNINGSHQEEQENGDKEDHVQRNKQDDAEADYKFGPILSIGKAKHSTRMQTKSALAHFSIFLAGYWDRLSSLKDYSSQDRKQLYLLLEDKDLKE